MADQEENEDLDQLEQAVRETEKDLLADAIEPPAKEPEGEAPAPEARARDPETGRFTKAEAPAQAPQEAQPAAEKPAEEEVLPSWRAREINEERRRVQAENEAMRADYARMQARMAQIERAQQPQQAPPPPDPLVDPAAYTRHVQEGLRAEFAAQLAHDRLNMNLEMTHMRHGEKFEKAYEAVIIEGQRGNHALVQHLTRQANPGEAIVRWWTDMSTRQAIGGDLEGYNKKQREALLDDDKFFEEMTQRRRERALGNGQQPPNTVVRLPGSLNRATGTAEAEEPLPDSESGLFDYAINSKRR
jgi:hypothetical protein